VKAPQPTKLLGVSSLPMLPESCKAWHVSRVSRNALLVAGVAMNGAFGPSMGALLRCLVQHAASLFSLAERLRRGSTQPKTYCEGQRSMLCDARDGRADMLARSMGTLLSRLCCGLISAAVGWVFFSTARGPFCRWAAALS